MPIPVPTPGPPGLTVTSMQIIQTALREIGVLASGETPSAAEGNDALAILNQMVDSWNAQRLLIFTIQRQVFPLVTGQQTYTMGAGGNFNVPRPPKIERMGVIVTNNPIQPLELPLDYLTSAQWAAIPVKNIQSSLPQQVWDDEQFPLRNLNYWPVPVPTTGPIQTAIYTWTAVSTFNDLGATQFSFPPGYLRALTSNLAIELAPGFGVQNISESLATKATDSKAVIEIMNAPLVDLRCDPALVYSEKSLYNWISDTPVRR